MSISRLTASLASVTNEVTVAAAALNFDFSLFKIEAPEEFSLIGRGLSANRRNDAEGGSAHVTARKLGALFDDIIPPIPTLVKAYGLRASEISSSPNANPKPSGRDGVFAAHVGADATTIWAAATSGGGTIAVHLLACLLARLWTGSEATSLWTEIVQRRRQEVAAHFDHGEILDYPTLSVARQEFTRVQLAEWDASARGWLRAADNAKPIEVKQLLLIVKNIDACVDRGSDPYDGVMRVWTNALCAMENLVKGIPQSVSDGAVLMAIWAWHLYPDLIVLRGAKADVRFKDHLVPFGGCLTLGLQLEDEAKMHSGVHWSLSLANLRFYGDPIHVQRTVVRDASRLTFFELSQVAFGSIISHWTGYGEDFLSAAEFFLALWDAVSYAAANVTGSVSSEKERQTAQAFLTIKSNWMHILVEAARPLIEAEGTDQQTARQLVKLGLRRGSHFLTTKLPAFFGLTDFETLFGLLRSEEARIRLLRDIASYLLMDISGNNVQALIRYAQGPERVFDYASVFSSHHSSRKRKHGQQPTILSKPKRWIPSDSCESLADFPRHTITISKVNDGASRREQLAGIGEEILDREQAGISSKDEFILQEGSRQYKFLIGDPAKAALFVLSSDHAYCSSKCLPLLQKEGTLRQATEMLRSNSVHIEKLTSLLAGGCCVDPENPYLGSQWSQVRSLRAFSSAARVYKLLVKATISPNVLYARFDQAHWIPKSKIMHPSDIMEAFQGEPLSRAQSFACIALLESGVHDIKPNALKEVMALSSSDSIYVTAPLLCDPIETPQTDEIRRIVGNIGRAGMAMLFAPDHPRLRAQDHSQWTVVNHVDFDGSPEDNFQGTSLHLSFTGFERNLDAGSIGAQDVDVYLLETRISLHHEGTWLADLNVLKSLPSQSISKLSYPVPCPHATYKAPAWSMTAIDNWDEYFDSPKKPCVVRAYRNWIARLSFLCISHQLNRRAIILPENTCWECYANLSVRITPPTHPDLATI